MERIAKINEMIAFLDKFEPEIIASIRKAYPNHELILRSDEKAGPSDDKELEIKSLVCKVATEAVVTNCNVQLINLKNKLRSTSHLRLFGQVLAAFGSASVITTLAADYRNMAFVSGGLSLVGTLIALIVEFRSRGLDGTKLDELYKELTMLYLSAGRDLIELKFFVENGFNREGIKEVISRCNESCYKLNRLFMFI